MTDEELKRVFMGITITKGHHKKSTRYGAFFIARIKSAHIDSVA